MSPRSPEPDRAATRDPIATVAALVEPTRRRLYEYVVEQRRPVGRDEAAGALDLARGTVAFHLDKLVDDGLLDTVHERLSGRSGPGAGRPAKLYLRSDRQVEVSLPGRRYDLAGALLAAAVEESERSGRSVRDSLAACARATGRTIGQQAAADGARDVQAVLADHGFEPHHEGAAIKLANCPFHELAQRHTELVCGMNLELVCGVLDGLGDDVRRARLEPSAQHCCVVLDGPDGSADGQASVAATH